MKVLIGTTEIAGYYSSLQAALQEQGVKADFFEISPHPMRYSANANSVIVNFANKFCLVLSKLAVKKNVFSRVFIALAKRLISAVLFFVSLPFYNRYIYSFSTCYLPFHLDLLLLRILGKKSLCIFHGSDTRPPYLNPSSPHFDVNLKRSFLAKSTKQLHARLKRIEKWCNWKIDNFASAHFHSTSFINHYSVGVPLRHYSEAPAYHSIDKLIILHCPSNPFVKGTYLIKDCMDKICDLYPFVEFREITGRPNHEVLHALDQCDFVIDQMFSDTPLAHFAAESAAKGKFAVVGGYGWGDEWLKVSGLSNYPSVVCHPDDLFETVEKLVLNVDLRNIHAQRAWEFARLWDYKLVSGRIIKILRGDYPASWNIKADDLPVFHSGGLVEPIAKRLMSLLVGENDWSSLKLDDKPKLLAKAKQFLRGHTDV